MALVFFLFISSPLCLLAGNLQPDFQIAVTHSILKLKSFLNTTTQNDLKWRKTCTGLKFDLELFNDSQTKFNCDSLYKHPVFEPGMVENYWLDRYRINI